MSEAAQARLAQLEECSRQAQATLARRLADTGDADADQVEHFALAWAIADLRAIRAGLGAGKQLDRELAALRLARRDALICDRLRETGVEPPPAAPQALDSGMRQRLGQAVIDAEGEVGSPDLGEGAILARDAFARFARDTVAPLASAIHGEDMLVPDAILQPMRELGAFGLGIPESYGGSAPDDDSDATTMIAVTEALSEASLGAAGSLLTRPEILARALLAGGTERQKAHWLPRLAAGDPLCAIAITEPDAGSDVASLRLRARPVEGGWRLDGAKTWCTFAGRAELLMVVARTDPDVTLGHRGLSLMLVEKPGDTGHAFRHERDGGVLAGTAIRTIGYRGMHSFDLHFDNWFVPADHVIGEDEGLGRGFAMTMAGMVGGRMQTAARACGVMRAALKDAIAHAGQRSVFGRKLDAYPLTLAKLADMGAALSTCRALTYEVAAASQANAADASLAKLISCRSAEEVTREALQLHGGMGYAEESAVSRYFVDARVLSIFEGAEETLALKVIARNALREGA